MDMQEIKESESELCVLNADSLALLDYDVVLFSDKVEVLENVFATLERAAKVLEDVNVLMCVFWYPALCF